MLTFSSVLHHWVKLSCPVPTVQRPLNMYLHDKSYLLKRLYCSNFPSFVKFLQWCLNKKEKSWNFHPLYINFRSNSRSKIHQINPIFTPLVFFWRYKALPFQLNFLLHPIKRNYLAINFVLLMGYLFNWFESQIQSYLVLSLECRIHSQLFESLGSGAT